MFKRKADTQRQQSTLEPGCTHFGGSGQGRDREKPVCVEARNGCSRHKARPGEAESREGE